MNKTVLGVIIAIVLGAAIIGAFAMSGPEPEPTPNTTPETTNTETETEDDSGQGRGRGRSGDDEDTSSDGTAAQSSSVSIQNFAYSPSTLTVKKGTKVTWTNQDSTAHTVTAKSGSGPDSELLSQGQSYSYTFNEVGTFDYFCEPHPNMVAKVVVTE